MQKIEIEKEYFEKMKKFAVFIPIIEVDGKDHILFEVRSNKVSQPGDVSFPGGHVEMNESFTECAKRELKEELCLNDSDFTLIGFSSVRLDYSNRILKSYYGRIHKNLEDIEFNEEVEEIFVISIDYLKKSSPEMYECELKAILPKNFPYDRIKKGKGYNFSRGIHKIYFYDTKPVIWGITAGFLKEFIESKKWELQ
ncbi:MAG: CoA pyrophosphatase [Tissierellia bacterium]|nr:CoA pyrophosphatase [Tissierellia bacterium]